MNREAPFRLSMHRTNKGYAMVDISKQEEKTIRTYNQMKTGKREEKQSRVLTAYQRNHKAIKRSISKILNNEQDIEDVAQEAFLRAYGADLKGNVRQPKSFLFRVAKNIAISMLRQKSNQLTDFIEEQSDSDVLIGNSSLEEEVIASQVLGIHCEAVATLPHKCRRVYLLRKVYGMSHNDISKKLGIAVSTVEKHLMKGVEICDKYVKERTNDAILTDNSSQLNKKIRASKIKDLSKNKEWLDI